MFNNTILELKRLYFIHGSNSIPAKEYKDWQKLSLETLVVTGLISLSGSNTFSPTFIIKQKAVDYIAKVM